MKTKSCLLLSLLTATLILSGCSSSRPLLSPAMLQSGVKSVVTYGVAKYPTAIPYVRAVEPIVCSAAAGTNLAPAEVVEAISAAGVLQTPESVFIINSALLLYQGIYNAFGADAVNQSVLLREYLNATCVGIGQGLPPDAVVAAGRSQWPMVAWPR